MAFPGFANGGCSRDTHVDMRMRGDTSRIATASVHVRVISTPALPRSQLLHLIGVRAGECAGQRGRKKFRRLRSCLRALRTLVAKGGVRTPKSPPWIRYCQSVINPL